MNRQGSFKLQGDRASVLGPSISSAYSLRTDRHEQQDVAEVKHLEDTLSVETWVMTPYLSLTLRSPSLSSVYPLFFTSAVTPVIVRAEAALA